MNDESPGQRTRRKFVFGVLEQMAQVFGAITASVLTVGLFLPILNAVAGTAMLDRQALIGIARLVLGFTAMTFIAAVVLRGLARLLEDDKRQRSAAGGKGDTCE